MGTNEQIRAHVRREAIAEANAHLSNVGLPSYSALMLAIVRAHRALDSVAFLSREGDADNIKATLSRLINEAGHT